MLTQRSETDSPNTFNMLGLVSHQVSTCYGTYRLSPGNRERPVERQFSVRLPNRQFHHRNNFSTTVSNISILRGQRELGTAGITGTISHGQHKGIAATVKVSPRQAFPTSRLERIKYLSWVPSDVAYRDDEDSEIGVKCTKDELRRDCYYHVCANCLGIATASAVGATKQFICSVL